MVILGSMAKVGRINTKQELIKVADTSNKNKVNLLNQMIGYHSSNSSSKSKSHKSWVGEPTNRPTVITRVELTSVIMMTIANQRPSDSLNQAQSGLI